MLGKQEIKIKRNLKKPEIKNNFQDKHRWQRRPNISIIGVFDEEKQNNRMNKY